MVEHVVASCDRVVCVVGLAGAGKTTAASAIHAAYRAEGTPILGAAPSGIAAQQLEDATAIPTTTLHRLTSEASRAGLPAGCVVLVDEAGMADTRTLAPLLDQVERARGKLILVGDPRQLPAVGAGGLYAALVDRHGAITLTENRRQHCAPERHALDRLRRGHGRDYLAHAERERRLITQPTPAATRGRLLTDWWSHARDNLDGTLIIAHRRHDVRQLNGLARGILDGHGRLGNDRLTAAGIELAVGDRVICRANDDQHGVRNGTRATITSLDPASRTVTLATDRGTTVPLTAAYLDAGHLDHGYAITGHAAQGVTIDTALVLADGDHRRLQEWGYVALSRARRETRLYLTEIAPEPADVRFGPDGRPDPRSSLAAALERTASEPLATEQAPLPGPAARGLAAIESVPAPHPSARQQEIARRLLDESFTPSI
ncbi:MAG: AAA family ATPase [Thermoleophilia bacterium]